MVLSYKSQETAHFQQATDNSIPPPSVNTHNKGRSDFFENSFRRIHVCADWLAIVFSMATS